MKRPGYYVEGRWFGDRFHQARARAAHLAAQYGRPVKVMLLAHGTPDHPELRVFSEVCEIHNKIGEVA